MATPKSTKTKQVSKSSAKQTAPKPTPVTKPKQTTPKPTPVAAPKPTPVAAPKPAPVSKPKPMATPSPKLAQTQRYDIARVLDACRNSYYDTIKLNQHRIQMASGSTRDTLVARCNNTLHTISAYYDKLLKLDQASKLPKTTMIDDTMLAMIQNHLTQNDGQSLKIDTTPLNHTSF